MNNEKNTGDTKAFTLFNLNLKAKEIENCSDIKKSLASLMLFVKSENLRFNSP